MPVPDRKASVTTLDCPVEIIPMVKNPSFDLWTALYVDAREISLGLQQSQEMKHAVELAGFIGAGYDDNFLIVDYSMKDRITFMLVNQGGGEWEGYE